MKQITQLDEMMTYVTDSSNSSAALDLCVKKRPQSPAETALNYTKKPTAYVDTQTCQYSPVSNNSSYSDSDTDPYPVPESTSSGTTPFYPVMGASRAKLTRPFKAYIKELDSLKIASTDIPFGKPSVEAFNEFRDKMMAQVHNNANGTNKNMRRVPQNSVNPKNDDPVYLEKRKKNNEAAKRSRDARRAKEDEMAIRCAFLERENIQLKFKVATLEGELQRLQKLMFPH